jgi:RsiW-degrading membrane proteinase PrsW (M82 family)
LQEIFCCVCQEPLTKNAKKIGDRFFCDHHYNKVFVNRKGIWISVLIGIVSIFAFAGLIVLLDYLVDYQFSGINLVIFGVLISAGPAFIWVWIFYKLDTLEPEPKGFILGVFLLGAIFANGIGIPLINGLFNVNEWLYNAELPLKIIGSILIIGFIQEYLKYAGVRFTVFISSEFDERVDGIIYGAVIGLGYATMLNIHYIISMGGVNPSVGVMRITISCLAHASFSGISGYFLGRAKFEKMPVWWMPSGVALAAVLNGVTHILLKSVSRFGISFTPEFGLIIAGVLASTAFGILFLAIRRINTGVLQDSE